MIKNKAPEALQASIDSLTAVVMRHGPNATTRTFVGIATNLGNGAWAMMRDNVFGGRVYDQFTGTEQIIDIWVHPVTGGEFPARWGHLSIMKPLAIIHAPGSGKDVHDFVSAAEMSYPEHRLVWRNAFGGSAALSWNKFDPTAKTVAVEGRIYHRPVVVQWNALRPEVAPAVCAGFHSPHEADAGGPVVDEDGRLAGMLLGPESGAGDEHKGWYMPIDYILPSLAMALEGAARAKGERLGAPVHFVEHRSHEVEFG